MTREEAIKRLQEVKVWAKDDDLTVIDTAIEALKEPERKHSKWINKGTCNVCASCKHIRLVPRFPPYCEMCGALMDGRQEGELE